MKDGHRTKRQLVAELEEMRQRVAALERSETDRKVVEQALRRIEWLLTKRSSRTPPRQAPKTAQERPYGNLVELNSVRLVLDSVGEAFLADIAGDFLDLLDTSAAIYERNGDYALGIFSSSWCKFLNRASWDLCGTHDCREALQGGKWHCHESCWNEAAKVAVEKGQPVDIECRGGIRLYAVPIRAGGEIVGAVNFGYGDPPDDLEELREVAERYAVPVGKLREVAKSYESRPPFIIETAKGRLRTSAKLIGTIVERAQAEEDLMRMAKFPDEDPNPVLRISKDGTILYGNKASSPVLNVWQCAVGQSLSGRWYHFVLDALNAGQSLQTELPCGERTFSLTFAPLVDSEYVNVYALDVSRSKRLQQRQELAIGLLERLNRPSSQREVIEDILQQLKRYTGFEALGIRLREGEDYPYYVASGFPQDFLQAEDHLCARNQKGEIIRDANAIPLLRCMCGNVLRCRTNPAQPFFTEVGSFWTNSTTELLASTTEAECRSVTRNRCNTEGYESVALIPLCSGDEIIGLLQLNDRRADRFTPELIRFLEGLGASIGLALQRQQTKEELETRVQERTLDLSGAIDDLQQEMEIRKHAEARLRESERRARQQLSELDALYNTIPVGICMVDGDLRYIRVNEELAMINGRPASEHIGLRVGDVVPQLADQIEPHTRQVIETGCPIFNREIHGTPAGDLRSERDWLVSDYPLKDEDGRVIGVCTALLDITERKQAEETLREGERFRAEAEKLAATGRMAARIAHEINNPLAGIMNCFQLVKAAVPREHRHYWYTELIEKEIDRIGRIVHQMFEFSPLRKGKPSEVNVGQTLDEVASMLEPSLREHEVQVEIHVDPSGVTVKLSEDSLRQVLYNLLENAIEASPPDDLVKVAVSSTENEICVMVSDRGEGIPDEVRENVFQPFFTTKRNGPSGGLGLGLSISKGIVDSLQGTLDFESRPGEGTVFRVVLPLTDSW